MLGEADVVNVNKIQDSYTLTPLSKYGTGYQPQIPENQDTTVERAVLPTGLEFFDLLGQLLKSFHRQKQIEPHLTHLRRLGSGLDGRHLTTPI